ncbi:hypothetical protein A0H81_03951 [Grifola frondosa]|uniref:Uncharacterized protein n=1 Tax=Grifola frondosa TaxID=5627 RepID=A0A1C7MPC9_GRIFR|nr:hypothetical protein A0H81_03951 [Grifola frondosa]
MCRYRHVRNVYVKCNHSVNLPVEEIKCDQTTCIFSPDHPPIAAGTHARHDVGNTINIRNSIRPTSMNTARLPDAWSSLRCCVAVGESLYDIVILYCLQNSSNVYSVKVITCCSDIRTMDFYAAQKLPPRELMRELIAHAA